MKKDPEEGECVEGEPEAEEVPADRVTVLPKKPRKFNKNDLSSF